MKSTTETLEAQLGAPGSTKRRQAQGNQVDMEAALKEWAWGAQQQNKQEGIFRFGIANTRGFPRSPASTKGLLIENWAIHGEYDILLLQEMNGNYSQYQSHEMPQNILRNYWKWTNVNLSWMKSRRREKHQYGGTGIITNNRLASCRIDQGGDAKGMGRWAWTTFRGKQNTVTTVISLYYPNKSKDVGSVESQQLAELVKLYPGERRDPFNEFRKDLRELISSKLEAGHRLVVAGDFNTQVTKISHPIISLLNQLGLKEAIIEKYGTEGAPPTRYPGKEQIDGVFLSQGLEIEQGGYIGNEISDHLFLWFDIKDTVLLGRGLEPFIKPPARRLTLKHPKIRRIFNELQESELERCNMRSRKMLLEQLIENGANPRYSKDIAEEYEQFYDCRDRATFYADKRCRKFRGGGIAYSDKVKIAIGEVTMWSLILSRMDKRGQMGRPSIKTINRKSRKWKFTHEWRSLTREEIYENLRSARTILRLMKPNSPQLRRTYLSQLAEEKAMEEGGDEEEHYRRLIREEDERMSWRRIGAAQGKRTGGLCSQVEKENEDGSRTLITEQKELIEEIIRANTAKLQQSNDCGPRKEPLRTYFGEDGDYDTWMEIWNGNKPIPPWWDVEQGTRLVFEKLTAHKGKAIDITWTEEDYYNSWKKMWESTVSLPGTHFGHYKAPIKGSLASEVNTCIANIPLQTGYAPNEWKKCTNSMLVKKANNLLAGKLRLITLLQAQSNHNAKRAGKCMADNAENLDMFAPEQYGSRKRKSSRVHALNKRLLLDSMIQAKKPLVLIANDATSCYDRIILLIAFLTYLEFGLSKEVAICLIDCLRLMEHNIRTCFGDSDETYGGEKWERSPHGNGQGNGTGPTLWAGISSLLLDIMRDHDFGIHLHSAVSAVALHMVGFSFVDDTDLVQEGVDGQDALRKAQQSLDLWESVLRGTGGAIEPPKSDWALIDYTWNNGKWSFKKKCENNTLRVRGPMGNISNLQQLAPDEARETLGIMQAGTGQEKTQTKHLLDKVNKWCNNVRSYNIPTDDVALAIRHTVTEKIRYGTIATSMTEKQCKSVMDPVIRQVMPKMKIARNIKRDVVHGSKDLLGLGIENVHIMQTGEKVQALVDYGGRTNCHTGNLINSSLELHLLEVGMGGNIFNMDSNLTSILMEKTWIRDATRSMGKYDVALDSKHKTLSLWRENDAFLMTIMCNYFGRFSKKQLQSINRCRRYLNVVTISDICDGDGSNMMIWAVECDKPPILTHTSAAAYSWPPHGKPSAQDRSIWKQALLDIIGTGSRRLRQRLGCWNNSASKHQLWKYNRTRDRVYFKSPDYGWIYYRRSSRRRTRTAKFFRTDFADGLEVLEAEEIPTIFASTDQKCFLFGSSMPLPPEDGENGSEDLVQHMTTHASFGWAVDNISFAENALDLITEQIENGTARVVTDGSTKDQRSSSGFLFIGKDDTNIFEGGNHIPGRTKDQNSFRSELGGILGLVLVMNYICKVRNITQGTITIGCDNTGALARAFDGDVALSTQPSYDIVRRISKHVALSPLKWVPYHVKGHQDDHKNYDDLDEWGKANVRAHNLAASNMDNHPGVVAKGFEADAGWSLKLNGENVCSNLKNEFYRHCTDGPLKTYWARKLQYEEHYNVHIDWDAMAHASKNYQGCRRRWMTKHLCNISATGRNMLWRKEWQTDQCPVCGEPNETSRHTLVCTGEGMKETYESSRQNLCEFISESGRPDMVDALLKLMDSARHNTFLEIDNNWKEDVQEAVRLQRDLGNLAFGHGFLVTNWRKIHTEYLIENESQKSPLHWISGVQRKIWNISWDMWRFRCNYAHGSEEVRELLLTANTIDDRISDIFSRIPHPRLLKPSERRSLLGLSETKVKSLRHRAKIKWADKVESILQNFLIYGVANPEVGFLRAWLSETPQELP